jgi:hypothetical protein
MPIDWDKLNGGPDRHSDPTPAPDEQLLTSCPGPCQLTGPEVYRAQAHMIVCNWMMQRARRCHAHDELLRPDEAECPTPWVPDETSDPHDRQGRGDRTRRQFHGRGD